MNCYRYIYKILDVYGALYESIATVVVYKETVIMWYDYTGIWYQ